MTSVRQAGSREEIPAFFPAGEETLFGIFTRPTVHPIGVAVIFLPGGGGTRLSTNRNRLWVRLCRRVASLGYHALRCDYRGAGESTGTADKLRLDQPFIADIDGAARWVERQGVSKFILVGSCFGARTALTFAPQHPGVRGLVLISPPTRDYGEGERQVTRMAHEWSIWEYVRRSLRPRTIKGLFHGDRRRTYAKVARAKWRVGAERRRKDSLKQETVGFSRNFLDPFREVIERKVPVMVIHGEGEPTHGEFQEAITGPVGKLLERAGSMVEVLVAPAPVHGFTAVRSQDAVADLVGDWLDRQRKELSV